MAIKPDTGFSVDDGNVGGNSYNYIIKILPSQVNFNLSDNTSKNSSITVNTYQGGVDPNATVYRIQFSCSTSQYGYDLFEIDGSDEILLSGSSNWQGTPKIKTKDLSNVPNGYYTGYFSVIISGKKGNDPWSTLAASSIDVRLSVNLPTTYKFSIDKNSDSIHYTRNNNISTSSKINVNSDTDYTINGPTYILANGEKLPKTFPAGTRQLIFTVDDSNQLEYGINSTSLSFRKVNQTLSTLILNILQTNTDKLETDTNTLSFSHLESLALGDWQSIIVYTPKPITISKPNWLEITLDTEISNVKRYLIRSTTKNIELEIGSYFGEIIFKDSDTEVKINVDFELYSYWNSDYNKDIHFSMENELLNFSAYQRNENNYLNITLQGLVYNNTGKVISINESLNLYFINNKTSFNLGEYIHDYFLLYEDQINDLEITSKTVDKKKMYDFARVTLEVTEINFTTKENVFWYSIPTQLFIKGHRPLTLTNQNIGFLGNHVNKTLRATVNGKTILSYLYDKSEGIKVYINGIIQELDIPIIQNAKLSIFSVYIDFSAIKCNIGDMVEFQLGVQVIRYQIFPGILNSNFISFIDYWGLLKIFEITGEYSFPISMNYTTFIPKKSTIKNVDSTRTNTLNINTGVITNDDIEIINEILSSPKCWFIKSNEIIEIIPTTEKLELFDSTDELYSYDLEFHINPDTYDKSYRN